ncbi:MAG: hypothetical protein KAY22_11220 [Rhizorhabdus sp.]|uniref:hypothetical protein n=1 Tax=Rhizorhabdus sp. TaxID=1968843 RepID=UPI001B61F151|nr:hypothetical protein [Rhizorhabdus sp.]MBP8232865.1 hypothetical protein [Rhizorhabdus sp.]
MTNVETKTDAEIDSWIRNYESKGGTSAPFYGALLEERARRSQAKHKLDFNRSLEHLKRAAIGQVCTTYGALAAASNVAWSQARHQMNGPNGHLDRLLDICHARGLPMLTALCVNHDGVADGELGEGALTGFAAGARRLGLAVGDARMFHHQMRDECWLWGKSHARTAR